MSENGQTNQRKYGTVYETCPECNGTAVCSVCYGAGFVSTGDDIVSDQLREAIGRILHDYRAIKDRSGALSELRTTDLALLELIARRMRREATG